MLRLGASDCSSVLASAERLALQRTGSLGTIRLAAEAAAVAAARGLATAACRVLNACFPHDEE